MREGGGPGGFVRRGAGENACDAPLEPADGHDVSVDAALTLLGGDASRSLTEIRHLVASDREAHDG